MSKEKNPVINIPNWFEIKTSGNHAYAEFEHDGLVTIWNNNGDELELSGMANVKLDLEEIKELYKAITEGEHIKKT